MLYSGCAVTSHVLYSGLRETSRRADRYTRLVFEGPRMWFGSSENCQGPMIVSRPKSVSVCSPQQVGTSDFWK